MIHIQENMVRWIGPVMAEEERNDDLVEEIFQLVQEHGDNVDDGEGRPAGNLVPPDVAEVPPPDEILLGEEWDNTVPADIADHPVIAAFQASNANFLISNPRIAGNPIIYASEVSLYHTYHFFWSYQMLQ